ncbi:MAG: ribosome maturation factor RimP [Thermoleophilia bacterium]
MKLTEAWVQQVLDGMAASVELVAFDEMGGRRHRVLRLFVDHPGGVTHELCAEVSGVVGEALDRADWSDGPYTLEVSSPGLERPLRRPEHFSVQVGKKIHVKTVVPVAGRKVWHGILLEVRGQSIVVREGDEEAEVRFDEIARAHLVYEFE